MAKAVESTDLAEAFRSGRMVANARARTFFARAGERLRQRRTLPFDEVAYLEGVRDAAAALSAHRNHTPARLLAVLYPEGMSQ